MATSTTTTTEERALKLLGQGIPPSAVASALGVEVSRISQLLSDDDFASKVVELKFESLSRHNERDAVIDGMEDKLLEQLKYALPMMTRPMEIIKAFSVLNAAKRRGQSAPEQITAKQSIIQLNIPAVLLQHFTTNVHNQVVQVGEQSLLTIPSANLLKSVAPASSPQSTPTVENANVRERKTPIPAPRAPTSVGTEQRSSPQNA